MSLSYDGLRFAPGESHSAAGLWIFFAPDQGPALVELADASGELIHEIDLLCGASDPTEPNHHSRAARRNHQLTKDANIKLNY